MSPGIGNTLTGGGLLFAAAIGAPTASDVASIAPANAHRSIDFFALTTSLPVTA
jgi:hypothetical protein